jgi:hypothetical protein
MFKSGLNGAPEVAGFDSRVMYGFFPHVKEVEDIGLINQPCKRSKTCLVIPKRALTYCWLLWQNVPV